MALKLLKVTVNLEVKADSADHESVREQVMEALQILIESDELEFTVDTDDESEEGYEDEN